jgi:hypothetical protein
MPRRLPLRRTPGESWRWRATGALIFRKLLRRHHGLAANYVLRVVHGAPAKATIPMVVANARGRASGPAIS